MAVCSSGKHYPEATLSVRKAGGNSPVEYVVFKLREMMVSSYETEDEPSSDMLREMVSLNFAKVEVAYQPQNDDGGKEDGTMQVRVEYSREYEDLTVA